MQPGFEDFLRNTLTDIEVKWKEQIQENFRRQGWYGEQWPGKRMVQGARSKTLYKEGLLQESVNPEANYGAQEITVSSPLPYAAIHNEGGEITVTAAMKKFFWAMHLKAAGAISRTVVGANGSRHTFISTGSKAAMAKQKESTSSRAMKMNAEAEHWKSLALMKVGSKLKIPRRRFVGEHPVLDAAIEKIVSRHVKQAADAWAAQLQANLNKNSQPLPGGVAAGRGGVLIIAVVGWALSEAEGTPTTQNQ